MWSNLLDEFSPKGFAADTDSLEEILGMLSVKGIFITEAILIATKLIS
jgi:hypothetical protein